jgi:RimJ/RimL family protein N-acetyltransferase
VVVKPYNDLDITKLRIREGDDWGGFSEIAIQSGNAFTVWDDDEPVAAMGIIPAYKHVGGVWAVITDGARGHGFELTRYAQNLLILMMRNMNMHRVQAFVKKEKPEYVRWAKLLGFEVEGVMRKGTPEQRDMYLMAKVI